MAPLSFAVLPLLNASNDPRQDYIADALTDYLTVDLSRIRDGLVIARPSAAAIAEKGAGAKAAADQLGVRYVLHGTASMRDGKIQVAVALFDAEPAKDLWAAELARPEVELSELRTALVSRVAQSADARPADAVGVTAPAGSSDPRFVDLLLQAKALLMKRQTAATTSAARNLLEAALRREAHSVEAMNGLASVHLAEALAGWSPAPLQDLARAQQLIDSALAADPDDSRALALRGALLRVQSKPAPALVAYEAAITTDPNFAEAHAEIGRLKIDLGQAAEAPASIERALLLSPLDPQCSLWSSFAGMALLYAGRPADAMPWLKKSVALNPDFLNPRLWLAAAYELEGETDKAADAVKTVLRLSPGVNIARLQRQLVSDNPRSRQQLSRILDALRRAGLSG